MLATLGITVFASFINLFSILSSSDAENNGMVQSLTETFTEIAKIPTGVEFLTFLDGRMTIMDLLARQAGDAFYPDFDHFRDRLQSYKAEPDYAHARPLLTDIIALIQNPAIQHSYDYVEACLSGTQHVLAQVNSDFTTWTAFQCLQILGEIEQLDDFNDFLNIDAIDSVFYNLRDNYAAFLGTPTPEMHATLVRNLEELISNLQKEKDKKLLSEEVLTEEEKEEEKTPA